MRRSKLIATVSDVRDAIRRLDIQLTVMETTSPSTNECRCAVMNAYAELQYMARRVQEALTAGS